MYKWIGSVLVFAGCGGFGLSLAGAHIRRERILMQLCRALDEMECELRYRLTKLPELCMATAQSASGPVRKVLLMFAHELESKVSPDPASCMSLVLEKYTLTDEQVRDAFVELGRSLGRFDLEGQIQGIRHVKDVCMLCLERERAGRNERIRCYRTLGFCGGAALVILLV